MIPAAPPFGSPGFRVLLLDAALGTELTRLGADTSPPLWSARPLIGDSSLIRRVHADEAAAGADVLTAATFRTHARNLRTAGVPGARCRPEADRLTRLALALAREGGAEGRRRSADPGRPLLVAGSLSPLEDCWRPELRPDDDALAAEHGEQAARFAGADLIVVETMNGRAEALAAARAAAATGLPVVVAFATDGAGRLLSGEALDEAALAVATALSERPTLPGLLAVGVNCVPARLVEGELLRLSRVLPGRPLAAWGNAGLPLDERAGRYSEPVSPADYALLALRWVSLGALLVGGCCGTTAAHTRELRAALDRLRPG